jgi:hypothetical protein
VNGCPTTEDPEEIVVANGETKLLEGHRAACVDGGVEEVVGPRIADDHRPERVVLGEAVGWSKLSCTVARPSRSLHSHSAYVAKPSFSQMCCQAASARLSPVPLVGELVHDDAVAESRSRPEDLTTPLRPIRPRSVPARSGGSLSTGCGTVAGREFPP